MSPEQASGDRGVDARTDVYALGTVLYEMLVGEPPYTGATAQAMIAKRISCPVPMMRHVRPSVSEALEHVVRKALALVPADRFASAAEFARTLASPAVSGSSETSVVTQAPRRIRPPTARRQTRIALLVGLGVLGVGGLGGVLWQHSYRSAAGTGATETKRLAVLPFENLGDSADSYFADGITDAVRGKLTALPGLRVTARRSSSQYRTTSKSSQQIGKELGVQYLLAATVRWGKALGGKSRVQVSPELIGASTGSAVWQQPFSAALTDIFQIQGDIAEQVAQALDVALGVNEQRSLAEKPTQALGAYDAFLRGEELTSGSPSDLETIRRAVGFYEKAVALDSTFVMAWVRLAEWHASLAHGGYAGGAHEATEAALARRAADRALALRPQGYEGHLALGSYYRYALSESQLALDEARQALRVAPRRPELVDLAGSSEMRLGIWDSALVHSEEEQQRDPRSVDATRSLATILMFLRRYPEALAACDRGLLLSPGDRDLLFFKIVIYLGQGDLSGAQLTIRGAPRTKGVPTVALRAAFPFWALEDQDQQHLLRLSPVSFNDHRETWAEALAETHWTRGDHARARVYADSARQTYEALLQRPSEPFTDAFRHSSLGVMLAFLDRKADAVREGTRGPMLLPVGKDAVWGPWMKRQLARIYTLVGEPDKALDQLEQLLVIPSSVSPRRLRIDPAFAALRGNLRFERLAASN